jgi:hypothetical protein
MEDEDLQEMFTPGDRQERVQIDAFFFFSERGPSEPSLTLPSGDPRTRKAARLRVGSPQEVVTGGEGSGGGEAVEKDGAVRFSFEREREREGSGESGSERVDRGERGTTSLP